MDPNVPPPPHTSSPAAIIRTALGFILIGLAWGGTTPFIRRAAINFKPSPRPAPPSDQHVGMNSVAWARYRLRCLMLTVLDLLKSPAYLLPLVINLTGSVWFFLLIGQSELSLTVPITNSLAFLFTVLGEWIAEGKVISKDTMAGMGLSLAGIALCVHSKT